MVMATSPILRAASPGKAIAAVVRIAADVAEFVRKRAPGVSLRFSREHAFPCPPSDLMNVYLPLAELRLLDRFGVPHPTGAHSATHRDGTESVSKGNTRWSPYQ